ncbi:large proline-rich protein BAG6 isoform X2 [Drosophila innubila]|uniref:large proline-rich protein BAG6 isoform X2 n=1 Tax=Drosophila innubila TaxID=198719 RepID=UPI00148E8643|nr:large proline-rich protein BAG6 isoform X2 [Drosophila innubila]
MLINLKVKTLDARTHEFSIDNEITIRQFKDQIAEKTNIAAENQRIIYQGRVLADDKQVKEYDVDGKVLHVAERPPFSQRGANATNNDEPMRGGFRNMAGRPAPRLRNSPYFRALDGMLVGTMAIPVNNGPLTATGTRTPPNRFPNSSSFCINRITVALHMIDCANNIAAYLENPEVGLNNQSLDILQRGRWTMESTVVEVGVSSTDMPRNNNIIDMVQDAVTAALSRNTPGRNYTVVQLPTVYTNEGGEAQQQRAGNEGGSEGAAGGAAGSSDTSEETTAAAAVIIEDVIETDDEAADGSMTLPGDDERSASPQAASGSNAEDVDATAAAEDNGSNVAVTGIGPRRRTRPQVLANVIQRYRTVQTRLSPFVDRYYEILEQDPAFEEQDNAVRENAQRIFDRVSEAFHYLSHAQHAISDLMLDLSQPGPRVLTCRPILVEQSGYIRSNNIFTPNLVGSPLPDLTHTPAGPVLAVPMFPPQSGVVATPATATATAAPVATNPAPEPVGNQLFEQRRRQALEAAENRQIAAVAAEAATAAAVAAGLVSASDNVEDPVDEPMVAPPTAPAAGNQPHQQPRPEMDPQVQMARLIQAVVNSATNDADIHVGFNAPNIMSINLPVHMMTAAVHPQGRPAAATDGTGAGETNASAPSAAGGATATSGGTRSGEPGADVHVGFNVPNIMSINLPVHMMTAAVHPQGRPSAATDGTGAGETTGAAAGGAAASTSSGTRSGEQRANTLPTTATQTRSTSRPQIQIGGNNNWAGRIAPTHTAFDRFLPCNSHHIREPEPLPQNNNNNNNNNSSNNSNRRAATADADAGSIALGGPDIAVAVTGTVNTANANANAASSTGAAAASAVAAGPVVGSGSGSGSSSSGIAAAEMSNLRAQLRSFLHHSVFEGAPINEETMPTAIGRALEWFGDSLLYLPQYEQPEYNSRDSVCNTLRQSLRLIIELCNASGTGVDAHFEQRLKQICEQFRKRLYSVLFLCLGSANAELYWRQLMRLLCVPLRSNFRNEALQFLCIYIDPTIPAHTDTADAQQFLVLRNAQSTLPTDVAQPFVAPPPLAFPSQPPPEQQSLDSDIEMADVATSSSSSSATELETPLPTVSVGSEPWHNNFVNDWLPVITRDLQTQSENRAQPPYSDAYISGMSAKRRKIIQTEKPSSNVECLIASGVQRAIQSTGLGAQNATGGNPVVNPDLVIGAIAHDAVVQASYTDSVRSNARERIKQDVDYKASKYPQIAKFTEQK